MTCGTGLFIFTSIFTCNHNRDYAFNTKQPGITQKHVILII